MVCEIMPYSSGLTRNVVQCLEDNGIPPALQLHRCAHPRQGAPGRRDRGRGGRAPPGHPGTEEYVPCDTLLLSVGLIPENELTPGRGHRHGPGDQRRGGGRAAPDQRAGRLRLRQRAARARPGGQRQQRGRPGRRGGGALRRRGPRPAQAVVGYPPRARCATPCPSASPRARAWTRWTSTSAWAGWSSPPRSPSPWATRCCSSAKSPS